MSIESTKAEANRLFRSEGPKHDLSIEPLYFGRTTDHRYNLLSTGGTSYCHGTWGDCEARKSELMTFAEHGH